VNPVRVIATAGHVDHGKSSLVQALTGTDPDRLVEEKQRGLTIDLGFAHTMIEDEAISFVDVPGHVRFLRNMLAGVGGVDACLFVIAATEGWKPQSEEHLRILELLGVTDGVVALTKVDLLPDEELVELATLELAERVAGSFLAGAPIVPVATPSGAGLDHLAAELAALARRTPGAADRGRPRLWVDRVFAARGSGTVVTGTLTGGALATDGRVVVEPVHLPARIRAIQTLGETVARIGPGNRVALNLVGVDHHVVTRGDAVVEPGTWWSTERFDASLTVLPSLTHDVSRRGAFLAYVGSGEHPVRLRVLGAESLPPGATGSVRVHLQRRTPLPLLPGDRYILRESGRDETVGGGEILDVAPVLPASRARPDPSVERVVVERGWVDVDELQRLTGERREPTVGRWVASDEALHAATESLRARLSGAGSLGLEVGALDERERDVLATLADVVVDGGYARTVGTDDPLAGHPFLAALAAGGMSPPAPDGIDRAELRELVRRGLVVERDGQWFHADALEAAAELAARLLAESPDGFTVSEFRDAAGVTRKHALPLVSELDARGITRRRGDVRVAGPRLRR
jgi:selenocysteine-specific elongation factor